MKILLVSGKVHVVCMGNYVIISHHLLIDKLLPTDYLYVILFT
jgi:hypothetical protein